MSTPLEDGTLANNDVIETIHISQLFPIVEALEDNQTSYREDVGVADAYKVDFSGAVFANEISAYQAGQQIVFKAANTNTGASTLQVSGPSGDLSAIALRKFGNAALEAGDIQAGQLVMVVYNDEGAGRFEMVNGTAEDGTGFYREDEGSTDAYEVDCSGSGSNPNVISAYQIGQIVTFKAGSENTGPCTLRVLGSGGSLAAKAITKSGGTSLEASDIQSGQIVMVVYNDQGGGRFEMMDAPAAAPSGGGVAGSWLYGDGMDGNETLYGDNYLGEHKFYHDLTINSGASLCTNGFKLHVSGTLTNNGTIHNNGTDGSDASGATPGGAGSGRNYGDLAWDGRSGGDGSLQSGDSVNYIDEQTYYARGGSGGDGSYGGGGSGDGGNNFGNARFFMSSSAFLSGLYDGDAAWSGARNISGGMGGGGGTGNDLDAAGGGGGGSGSILWVAASSLAGDGELQARGGNGGNAGGTDAGGGGGGGGGIIYLLTNESSSPYSYNVDGGEGGSGGGGSGTDGGQGDQGLYIFRGGL